MIETLLFSAAVVVVPARPVVVPVRPVPARPAAPAPAKPTHVDAPHPANPVYSPVFVAPHRSCDTKDKDCKKEKK